MTFPRFALAARSLPGARRLLFALLLTGLTATAASAQRNIGPPPWRVGGRMGFTVDTVAEPDTANWTLSVLLRVPPSTLRALARDAGGEARVRATVRLRGNFGAKRYESTQEFAIAAGDTVFGQGKVLRMRFPAGPGPCRVWAKLEDLQSRKRGLVYSARTVTESAVIEGDSEVPIAQARRDMSDVTFLWPDSAKAGSDFLRAGHLAIPNPERLYGLYAPQLRAGFSARARAGDERPWRWVARVYADSQNVVAQVESTAAAGRWMQSECRFDLSTEPAGGYTLEVKAWQEGDAGALLRRAHFSLGWLPETWLRGAAELTDEAHFLLGGETEEEDFQLLQPGEQERYMADYWRRRDPTPETAFNEALDGFRSRVVYANQNYTRFGLDRGMFSDMGRTYIRYGEPSEVLRQVVPAGDDDLARVIAELNADEDRPVGVGQKRGDQRAWEVWVYEGTIPVPVEAEPDDAAHARHRRRLVFLFVDDQGIGNFTLRYSTE